MNKTYKPQKQIEISKFEEMIKGTISFIEDEALTKSIFNPNKIISTPQSTFLQTKRKTYANTSALDNEYNVKESISRRGSNSTLYKETESSRKKAKANLTSVSVCKSEKSMFSDQKR